MSNYAWVIINDWTEGGIPKSVEVIGPSSTKLTAREIMEHQESREFRLLDDDGNLYYEGYFLGDGEDEFAPMDDYGEPNAGCTSIEYWDEFNQEWEEL